MAHRNKGWDFECPQYVDFERELDKSAVDVFFDHKDKSLESGSLCTPGIQADKAIVKHYPDAKGIQADKAIVKHYPDAKENKGRIKGLTDSDENRLLDKMSVALSILENTPKVKKGAPRGKLFSEMHLKSYTSHITKSTVKLNVPRRPLTSKRRSKSLTHLNKVAAGKTNKTGLPRTSSMTDLRICRKSKYPVTPMCLKRTILKAKEKIKSTEERELEEIAKLQKQLIQHLRQNEISLRKLKLKPRSTAIPKHCPKLDGVKEATGAETLITAERERRRAICMLSHAEMKKEVAKPDNIINKESSPGKKMNSTIYSKKLKNHSVSTVDSDASTSTTQNTKKQMDNIINKESSPCKKMHNTIYRNSKLLSVSSVDLGTNTSLQGAKKQSHKRLADHSGLIFFPSLKNSSLKVPLFFEAKAKQTKPQIPGSRQEKSAFNLNETDKENVSCIGPQSFVKAREINNVKCDTKLMDSNKLFGKSVANLSRGMPLAENITRN